MAKQMCELMETELRFMTVNDAEQYTMSSLELLEHSLEEATGSMKVECMQKEPPLIVMVLKVHMHCKAYAEGIWKRILNMKGVQSIELDLKALEVSLMSIKVWRLEAVVAELECRNYELFSEKGELEKKLVAVEEVIQMVSKEKEGVAKALDVEKAEVARLRLKIEELQKCSGERDGDIRKLKPAYFANYAHMGKGT
jgi:hypothetical protein